MHAVDDLATDDVQGVGRAYRSEGPGAVDKLVAALRGDSRPRVRANAVTALLAIYVPSGAQEDARRYLLDALGDPDYDVQSRAAEGLAAHLIHEPGVREALTKHLPSLRAAAASPDHIVQAHAIGALEKMGERPPATAILTAHSSAIRRRGIEQAANARDAAAVPLLIEIALHDPEVVARMEAIPVAAQLASPEVRDAFLGPLIDDPEDAIANTASTAAGETGAVNIAERLRKVLAAPGGGRTNSAIVALAALKDKTAVPAIAAHLSDPGVAIPWDVKLALDVLVGPPRGLLEWQAWAQQEGYMRTK